MYPFDVDRICTITTVWIDFVWHIFYSLNSTLGLGLLHSYLHITFRMARENGSQSKNRADLSGSKSKYPCGKCDREVSWEGRGVACESCGIWFHATCQGIGKSTYINL